MVNLSCRKCGSSVASDEKARKCRHCGELFPFACAVCSRKLRPPIPDFPVERFFNEAGEPLCEDHYQRQCPECSTWFRADENPGYFLCPDCTHRRESEVQNAEFSASDGDEMEDEVALTSRGAANKAKSGCGVGMLLILVAGGFLFLAPVLRAAWP